MSSGSGVGSLGLTKSTRENGRSRLARAVARGGRTAKDGRPAIRETGLRLGEDGDGANGR